MAVTKINGGLNVAGGLQLDGTTVAPVGVGLGTSGVLQKAGSTSITGTGTIAAAAHGLSTISSVVATLKSDPLVTANNAFTCSATWSGTTVTLKCWQVGGAAAVNAATVNWVITGS